MSHGDQLLRAYSTLTSLRDGIPDGHEVAEKWAHQYNDTVTQLEITLDIALTEFKVPSSEILRRVVGGMAATEEHPHGVTYSQDMWCETAVLMQRLNALLGYFSGLQQGCDKKIGFRGAAQDA